MKQSGIFRKAAAGLGALAVPVVFAVAGAGQASADDGPNTCITGPFGYASACVNWPGWVDWQVPHWNHRWHGGDDDWQGDE